MVARNALGNDVDAALGIFLQTLDDVADKHGRCVCFQRRMVPVLHIDTLYSPVAYVKTLAGIGGFKKVKKGTTTAYGVFCGKTLEEMNKGTFSVTVLQIR
jgi:hypothetical protein